MSATCPSGRCSKYVQLMNWQLIRAICCSTFCTTSAAALSLDSRIQTRYPCSCRPRLSTSPTWICPAVANESQTALTAKQSLNTCNINIHVHKRQRKRLCRLFRIWKHTMFVIPTLTHSQHRHELLHTWLYWADCSSGRTRVMLFSAYTASWCIADVREYLIDIRYNHHHNHQWSVVLSMSQMCNTATVNMQSTPWFHQIVINVVTLLTLMSVLLDGQRFIHQETTDDSTAQHSTDNMRHAATYIVPHRQTDRHGEI